MYVHVNIKHFTNQFDISKIQDDICSNILIMSALCFCVLCNLTVMLESSMLKQGIPGSSDQVWYMDTLCNKQYLSFVHYPVYYNFTTLVALWTEHNWLRSNSLFLLLLFRVFIT
jgi:hypothetical protein